MKRLLLFSIVISLAALTAISCNLDGEGLFYGISRAEEYEPDSGYTQIPHIVEYDGTTATVVAGTRIAYKTSSTSWKDYQIDPVKPIIKALKGPTDYFFLVSEGDSFEVRTISSLSTTTTNTLSDVTPAGADTFISMFSAGSGEEPYLLYADSSDTYKIKNLATGTEKTLTIDPGERFIQTGTFALEENSNTHIFLSTDDDKTYYSSDDGVTFTEITATYSGEVRGGVANGSDIYLFTYAGSTLSVRNFTDANTMTEFDTVSSLTSPPVAGSIPAISVDSDLVLLAPKDSRSSTALYAFDPGTADSLDDASGYSEIEDKLIRDFYRIGTDNFLTATNDHELWITNGTSTVSF